MNEAVLERTAEARRCYPMSFEEHFKGTTMFPKMAIHVDFVDKRACLPLVPPIDDGTFCELHQQSLSRVRVSTFSRLQLVGKTALDV